MSVLYRIKTQIIFLKSYPINFFWNAPLKTYLNGNFTKRFLASLKSSTNLKFSYKLNFLPNSKYVSRSQNYSNKSMDFTILKDVTLFTHDNPQFFKWIKLCAVAQIVFWVYLGYIAATTMKDAPISQEELLVARQSISTKEPRFIPIIKQLNPGKYKNIIAILCEICGKLSK